MAAPKGATETDTFIPSNALAPPPSKWKAFTNFLYDRETGRVFGRTGKSWLQITLFYMVFYAVLAAFFAVLLVIFLQTLDPHEPKWQNANGIIGNSPGLGFRPSPVGAASTLIWLKPSSRDPKSMNATETYIDGLKKFFKDEYDQEEQGNLITCSSSNRPNRERKEVCRFDQSKLGQCSLKNSFGYRHGQPCVLLKLNKIFGWEPELFNISLNIPEPLSAAYARQYENRSLAASGFDPDMVYFTCEGEEPVDKEHMGPIRMNPQGIPSYFFPYTNTKGYQTPIVMVEFLNPDPGFVINVECRAWANNIKHNRADRLGLVHFEILVDDKE